jgi:hypothetical protein
MRRGIADSHMVTFHSGHLFFVVRERKWFLDSLLSDLATGSSLNAS